jgi:hypothetical protein
MNQGEPIQIFATSDQLPENRKGAGGYASHILRWPERFWNELGATKPLNRTSVEIFDAVWLPDFPKYRDLFADALN